MCATMSEGERDLRHSTFFFFFHSLSLLVVYICHQEQGMKEKAQDLEDGCLGESATSECLPVVVTSRSAACSDKVYMLPA